MIFVPQAISTAGLCLNMANWSELGIKALAFSLVSLLLKPGYTLLKKLEDVRSYLAWSGVFILNAEALNLDNENNVTIVSAFDGSKVKLSASMLLEIILHIKPDIVILPKKFLKHWKDEDSIILPYYHAEDLVGEKVQSEHGIYFNVDDLARQRLAIIQPGYISGSKIDYALMKEINSTSLAWIESDIIAQMAMSGKVYSQDGVIDIKDDRYELKFECIAFDCNCPTCSQKLTKAYLHHLLQHTPLLCQRFLIQHNIFYISQMINTQGN